MNRFASSLPNFKIVPLHQGALVLILFLLSPSFPVFGGTIFLSGDTSLGLAIDGSDGAPTTPGNSTWFGNILGAGSSVKIHNESSSTSLGFTANAIDGYYNGLGGVTSNILGGTITSSVLAGVDLFLSLFPDDDYTASEISALSTFLNGGGSLFFLGEAGTFAAQNARINTALVSLGSSMNLGAQSLDAGFHTTTNIDVDPFNVGVSSFSYAFTSTVLNGGTSLLRTVNDSGAQTIVAYETIVPEPTALLLMVSGGLAGIWLRRRTRA